MFKPAPFRTQIIPDFYPRALEMRAKIDEFFANPQHANQMHFVWNLWYVKDHYDYARASAPAVIGHELYQDFRIHLLRYARQIGLNQVSGDYLSLYRNGAHQRTHSDMMNGSVAYSFSLTNWESRKFSGGETLVAREGVFDRLEPRQHMGEANYWHVLAQPLGQLSLFDDRVAHQINTVIGSNDPVEGRFSIHGHIY